MSGADIEERVEALRAELTPWHASEVAAAESASKAAALASASGEQSGEAVFASPSAGMDGIARYNPYPYEASFFNLTMGITAREWAYTALSAGVMYGMGHQYVRKLGVSRLSGNRLGMVLAFPALVIAYTSNFKNSVHRHLGLVPNGEAPLGSDGSSSAGMSFSPALDRTMDYSRRSA